MTHGDKSKAKKTASKASASQKSKAVQAGKSAKNGKSSKTGKENGAQKASPKAAEKASPASKASPAKGGGDAKLKARGPAGDAPAFTNPLVGAGFKRALKKYPNAFRRLTD